MHHSEEWSCSAQATDKSFCGKPSVMMAPFPICVEHLAKAYEFLGAALDTASAAQWDQQEDAEAQGLTRPLPISGKPLPAPPVTKVHAPPRVYRASDPVTAHVYYVQLGGLVKIGTTADLRQRLADYPPHSEVLAVERGYFTLEKYRHHQFRRLRAYSAHEWFYYGADLSDHVEMLQAAA